MMAGPAREYARRAQEFHPSRRRPAVAPPFEVGRPIRLGVINNPRSGRNLHRRILDGVLDVLADHPEVPHREVDTKDDIVAATLELWNRGSEVIVVNGGDGTVQAVLTVLLGSYPGEKLPLLAIVPGGTTNMIAGDVDRGGPSMRSLRALLGSARFGRLAAKVVERPVMRMDLGSDTDSVFGMFFGAGAIYHGIRFCRQYIHTLGLRGETGPGLALAVFLSKVVLGGQGGALFPPLTAWGTVDGKERRSRQYLGIMATTLNRLFLGLDPFWGEGRGDLRMTALSYGPRYAWRAALPIMRGKPNAYVRPENGYESLNADDVMLHIDSGFTLDGELYTPLPGEAVALRGGYSAFFLRRSR